MMGSLRCVPEASSPSYGGETQANMQIWGPITKGLLIQAAHMGYVYNTNPLNQSQIPCTLTRMLTLF